MVFFHYIPCESHGRYPESLAGRWYVPDLLWNDISDNSCVRSAAYTSPLLLCYEYWGAPYQSHCYFQWGKVIAIEKSITHLENYYCCVFGRRIICPCAHCSEIVVCKEKRSWVNTLHRCWLAYSSWSIGYLNLCDSLHLLVKSAPLQKPQAGYNERKAQWFDDHAPLPDVHLALPLRHQRRPRLHFLPSYLNRAEGGTKDSAADCGLHPTLSGRYDWIRPCLILAVFLHYHVAGSKKESPECSDQDCWGRPVPEAEGDLPHS